MTRLPASATRVAWWSTRRVAWLGGLFIAAMAGQAAFDVWRGYRATVDETQRELYIQSRVIAEQTARSVQAVDVMLRHVAAEFRHGRLARLGPDELHAYLRDITVGLKQIDGLGMFDASGEQIAVSWPAPRKAANMSTLPRFQQLRDDPKLDFVIFEAAPAAGDGTPIVPFGRRLESADGRFAGVVAARGRVDYFEQFYRDAYPEPTTRVALLHRRATLLARHPPSAAALGQRFPALESLLPSPGGRPVASRGISPVDGVDRFAAIREVPDYPLVVVVTREASAALAPWRSQAIGSALRTLALAALAALLLAVALRQLARVRAASRSLAESEERYALAMTGSRGGHWVWDAATDGLFVSATLNELLGLPPDTRPGTRREYLARVAFHADDRERVLGVIEDQAGSGAARADYECRILLPDGTTRWVLNRAQRFSGAAGQGTRIAGVSVDITERKQAEAQRERLEQQLRQAQKLEAIGTLAGGIAHDFNNILSAILGYGELALKGAPEGSAQRRHLDASLAAGQRAKSLVERILAFSRSGMGERVPVHVQSVVDEALDGIAATLPAGVRLERRLAGGDAGVLGDATQIHQVVMNLCANAVQAMRAEGRLCVTLDTVRLAGPLSVSTSTLPAGDMVRLAVADSGSGIEPHVLERIFDPFFTTKEVGVGTGLGLSLVHGIVTDLGGGIAVDSRLGEGSSFTIYLPRHGVVAAPAADAAAELVRGDGQTVMLVDDEEPLVRLGEELLAGLGYEAVGFVSSRAALDALRARPERFDAVLSDESMPGLTGTELAAEARRLRTDMPIVLMSGFVGTALLQRARAAGVAEVLSKPLAAREIARALAAALRSRAA